MKRAGFTMIELIFVIVILGILSAVALPKFIGVSQQAHDQKVNAFIGTLNRTVGPAMWADSIASGSGGTIPSADCTALVATQLDAAPEEVIDQGDCTFDANTTLGGSFGINFTDGNSTSSPRWSLGTTIAGGVL